MTLAQKLSEAQTRTIAWSKKIPVVFPDCEERKEPNCIGRYKKICFECRVKNQKKINKKLGE